MKFSQQPYEVNSPREVKEFVQGQTAGNDGTGLEPKESPDESVILLQLSLPSVVYTYVFTG